MKFSWGFLIIEFSLHFSHLHQHHIVMGSWVAQWNDDFLRGVVPCVRHRWLHNACPCTKHACWCINKLMYNFNLEHGHMQLNIGLIYDGSWGLFCYNIGQYKIVTKKKVLLLLAILNRSIFNWGFWLQVEMRKSSIRKRIWLYFWEVCSSVLCINM